MEIFLLRVSQIIFNLPKNTIVTLYNYQTYNLYYQPVKKYSCGKTGFLLLVV